MRIRRVSAAVRSAVARPPVADHEAHWQSMKNHRGVSKSQGQFWHDPLRFLRRCGGYRTHKPLYLIVPK